MKAIEVAEYLISIFNINNISISHVKLQKLLYYSFGYSFIHLKNPIFEDKIEAWKYGPVVRNVYTYFRYINHLDTDNMILKDYELINKKYKEKYKNETEFLDNIYILFKDITASEIVKISHNESPWKNTFKNGEGENNEISKDSIKEYFLNNHNRSYIDIGEEIIEKTTPLLERLKKYDTES